MAEENKEKEAGEKFVPPTTEDDDIKQIWVKSTKPTAKDGGSEIVLHEFHDAHPDGEVIIAGSKAVLVGETPAVAGLITKGVLVKSSKPKGD